MLNIAPLGFTKQFFSFSLPKRLSLFIALGFVIGQGPGIHAAINSQLAADIESYIRSLRSRGIVSGNERTAWLVTDLSSGSKLASINENTALQAASMVKPYLALAFFHQVRAGNIIYGSKSRRQMELMIQKSNN